MTFRKKACILATNRAFYAEAAAGYDTGRSAFYAHERQRIALDLKRVLSSGQWSGHVVDIGCGTGFYGAQTAAAGAISIHCVDLNQAFLDSARANLIAAAPQIHVTSQEADLERFLDAPGDTLCRSVLIVLGSVLQYVPDHMDQMKRLIEMAPKAMFLIASTPVRLRGNLFEEGLAALDYWLHKIMHGRNHGGAQGELVAQPVDPERLSKLFDCSGFNVCRYRYRTFHTPLVHHFYFPITRLLPSIASRFTLLAWPAQTEGDGD